MCYTDRVVGTGEEKMELPSHNHQSYVWKKKEQQNTVLTWGGGSSMFLRLCGSSSSKNITGVDGRMDSTKCQPILEEFYDTASQETEAEAGFYNRTMIENIPQNPP